MAPRSAKKNSEEVESPPASTRQSRSRAAKQTKNTETIEEEPVVPEKRKAATNPNAKSSKVKKTKVAAQPSEEESNDASTAPSSVPVESKPKKAPAHQVLTERDVLPKLWNADKNPKSYTFKVASWNVAGIRAVLKKDPQIFAELVAKHDLDVVCLQETKLQEQHLQDPKLNIVGTMNLNGYDAFWTCSTAKKGYAGTAVFVKRHDTKQNKNKKSTIQEHFAKSQESPPLPKQETLPIDAHWLDPEKVSYEMGRAEHDAEGRIIMVDFPLFSLCNVYVPNAGQKLERLTYRTDQWDKDFLKFMQKKQTDRGVPVLWVGDLNVAHTHLEVWNDGAKHLNKQAGVTPEERASFQCQLDSGFVDAFRKLHPTAAGHYSYWSTRAGNREPNKGLRLDYFICDPALFDEEKSQVVVRDSYMDYDIVGSDHCPVILEMEIKPTL